MEKAEEDKQENGHPHGHELMLRKEQHISTYLLELGIASHSIIVGK